MDTFINDMFTKRTKFINKNKRLEDVKENLNDFYRKIKSDSRENNIPVENRNTFFKFVNMVFDDPKTYLNGQTYPQTLETYKLISLPNPFFNLKTHTNRGIVLYRFCDTFEYSKSEAAYTIPCYNFKNTIDDYTKHVLETNRKQFLTSVGESVIHRGAYLLNSNTVTMSVENYLSESKGKGGPVVGFNEYSEGDKDYLHFAFLSSAFKLYNGDVRKCVFIFKNDIDTLVTEKREATLEDVIGYEPNKLIEYRLGSLMPEGFRNSAEYNYVGRTHIPCYVIDSNNINCVKTALSAAYFGYLNYN